MFPKLIELGSFTLHSYGLLLATACLLSIALAARLLERDEIPRERAWDLGFIIILSAIIGAKLLMVIADLNYYFSQPSRFLSWGFWQAGGVFYGGLMGAVLGSYLYLLKHRQLPFWTAADGAAPAIALGQSIGRFGCFAAGCDYGTPVNLPWAVTFTSEYANRYVGVPINVALHPVQLYESTATLLLCGLLLWRYGRKRFAGQIFCLYLMIYPILRFGLEFFRGDADRGFVLDGLLSTSQFIGLLLFPTGVLLYFYLGRKSQDRRKSQDTRYKIQTNPKQ